MSKKTSFLISTLVAAALLLIVLAGIAFAKAPEASNDAVVNNATRVTSAVTITVDTDGYTPKEITEFDTYKFTYPIVVHNQTQGITPTVRCTVTLDSYLQEGTALLPDGGTAEFPLVYSWTSPLLAYCVPVTLTIEAYGAFDDIGTLDLIPGNAITTTVECDGESEDLVTRLLLYKLYCPLIMRNSGG